jgi:hypothetical protein
VKTVGGREPVGGVSVPVHAVRDEEDGILAETTFQLATSAGVDTYGEDDRASGCLERLSPPLRIPDGLKLGETRTQTVAAAITGDGCANPATLSATIAFEALETVIVPAGHFQECAKLRIATILHDATGKVVAEATKTLFLAAGVGMVKEIEDDAVARLESALVRGRSIPHADGEIPQRGRSLSRAS